jgi:CRP/FNR family transcriptional regulator, transcriptional activator FtrB
MPMQSNTFPEIRALPLFQNMATENFDALARGGYVQTFPPQVELISEGDPSDFLYVVIDGTVELFAGWNRRETTMAILRPISTFILAATIRDAPYLMSARTVEKARIVLIPSQDVRAIFDVDNDFARAVVAELAQCYRSVVKSAKDMKLRNSVERLANYLLRQYGRSDDPSGFELVMEKRRLASFLGMTPENMSRAIKALQPYGVTIDGTRVHIADPGDLARLAKPTPLIDDQSH